MDAETIKADKQMPDFFKGLFTEVETQVGEWAKKNKPTEEEIALKKKIEEFLSKIMYARYELAFL